jgi:DNA-binding response OmpR family regulator
MTSERVRPEGHHLNLSPAADEISTEGLFNLYPGSLFAWERKYLSQFGVDSPTVLLVEDSDDIRHLLSLELQHKGCCVITAADGSAAVETALSMRPDLIVMDLNLPRLDGLAATEQIRLHVELSEVPIIAVTAFDTFGIRDAVLSAGCQDYLLKPLNPEALDSALRKYLPGFDFAVGEPADSPQRSD